MKHILLGLALIFGLTATNLYAEVEDDPGGPEDENAAVALLQKAGKSLKPGTPEFCSNMCTKYTCGKGSQAIFDAIKKIGIRGLKPTDVASVCKAREKAKFGLFGLKGCTREEKVGDYTIRVRFGDWGSIKNCVKASNKLKEDEGKGPTVDGIMKRKEPAVYKQEDLDKVRAMAQAGDEAGIRAFVEENLIVQ